MLPGNYTSLETTYKTNTLINMIKIIFTWYLITGVVSPTEEVDGRQTYSIKLETSAIDYAYKEEILEWIETGTFEYNEDLN